MLNEDRKKRFYEYKLNTTVTNITPIVTRLKRAAKFENVYKKDLCDFTLIEIMEMYKLLNYTAIEAIVVMNNTLIHYTDWCLSENLVANGQNLYQTLTSDVLMSLLNRAVIDHQIVSRDTVLSWTEQMKNPRDRFIVLSIFEFGKSKKDFENIIYAKLEDINEDTHEMKLHSGRIVHVSEELISCAKLSNIILELTTPYGRNAKLEDNGTIINKPGRAVDTPHNLGRCVYNALTSITKELNIGYMTAERINASGQVYMTNELARKHGVSGKDVLYNETLRREINNQYGISIKPAFFMKKYGDYLI